MMSNDGSAVSDHTASALPLDGITVVALEQAVAAPYCTSRLADMGARVIKIERTEGDFARGYDRAVHGEASYFVWINRGKESIALDLRTPADAALLQAMIARADVFVQNFAPGAAQRLGVGSAMLRERHPRLVCCDISGYGMLDGDGGPKAYDLLVQAESGLVAVSGAPGEWGRIGVSLCDIGAGMNAVIGILQALMRREVTGMGDTVSVSLFGTAAELMGVPYLQTRYGGKEPKRVGLRHPTVAPYGAFRCRDGREIVLSIQNEREWARFCAVFLGNGSIATEPRFADNASRCEHREALDSMIQARFDTLDATAAIECLLAADTAFGSINSVRDLIAHPRLRTVPMRVGDHEVQLPAVPYETACSPREYRPAPGLDEHGAALRREFGPPGAA